jgi:type VI secretion system protein VasI
MTDQPEVVLSLAAADDPRTLLIFRCRRNRTEAFISPREFLGSVDPIDILVRIGDRPATSQRWNPSTTGRAAFSTNPIEFIRSVQAVDVLRMEISPRHSGRISLRFETRGLREVIGPLQAACNWR